MAAEVWTVDEMVTDCRAQGSFSEDDPAYSSANIIAALNRAQKTTFVPAVRAVRAEYYVTHADTTLVADQAAYQIPHRSATNSVRQVFWIDSADKKHELYPVSLGDQLEYSSSGRPVRYTVQDDSLVLLPTPNAALGTLRVVFERRPSSLVLVSECAAISSVTQGGGDYGLVPVVSMASFDDIAVDVVRARPPFSLAMRDVVGNVVLGVLAVTPASWDTLPLAGDYVCRAGETCFPQIPVELHPMLSLCAAIKLLRPIDPEGSRELQAEFDLTMPKILASLAPRQQGRQQKIGSKNSYLRRTVSRAGRSGFSDWE